MGASTKGITWAPLLLAGALGTILHASVSPAPQAAAASRFMLASITDADGRAVVDVNPDDFVVQEDGQTREVLSVRLADYPVAVILDNGRGAGSSFETMRLATRRFLERIGHRPMAVASTVPPRLLVTLTGERSNALQHVDKLQKSRSVGGLSQALVAVAGDVRDNGAPFSAIVIVTASLDSAVTPEAVQLVIESGGMVHLVVQPTSGRATPTQRQSGDMLLSLVNETHGQVTTIHSAVIYQAALDREANQLSSELMIEYLVPSGSTRVARPTLGVRLSDVKVAFWGVSR